MLGLGVARPCFSRHNLRLVVGQPALVPVQVRCADAAFTYPGQGRDRPLPHRAGLPLLCYRAHGARALQPGPDLGALRRVLWDWIKR